MEAELTALKQLALHGVHVTLGAKLCPFAGYGTPVQYAGINAEHLAVRNAVGVFDVSHMGEFLIRGAGALALIQKVSSNGAAKLEDGKVQYSCMPNHSGGIVNDLLIYRIDDETYMLVVNAANIEKDWGAENFCSHLKRTIDPNDHWVSKHHLQMYVNEDLLRFNTRETGTQERFDYI